MRPYIAWVSGYAWGEAECNIGAHNAHVRYPMSDLLHLRNDVLISCLQKSSRAEAWLQKGIIATAFFIVEAETGQNETQLDLPHGYSLHCRRTFFRHSYALEHKKDWLTRSAKATLGPDSLQLLFLATNSALSTWSHPHCKLVFVTVPTVLWPLLCSCTCSGSSGRLTSLSAWFWMGPRGTLTETWILLPYNPHLSTNQMN